MWYPGGSGNFSFTVHSMVKGKRFLKQGALEGNRKEMLHGRLNVDVSIERPAFCIR